MELPTAMCSQCGYDLRGIASERCPECGFELALQPALTGEIPWTYRKPRGRARSFMQTVLKVTRGGPWISRMTAGPVSMRDARRFWLVAATITALPLLLAIAYAQLRVADAWVYLYAPDPLFMSSGQNVAADFGLRSPWSAHWPGWIHSNVLWPITAGLEVPGMAILSVWLFVLMATGVQTYLFHPRRVPSEVRQRATAFSYYLGAPLVLSSLPVLGILVCNIVALERQSDPPRILMPIALLCAVLIAIVGVIWLVRLVTTLRTTTAAGGRSLAYACVFVLIGWAASACFALLFVPWCVGVARLLIEALR